MYALFGLSLGAIALIDRRLVAARWASLGFFIAGTSILFDGYRDLTSVDAIAWFTIFLHFAALLTMMQAFIVRHEAQMPRISLLIAVLAAVLLIPGIPWEGPAWMRTMIVQGTGAIIILAAVRVLWKYRGLSLIDLAAFFVTLCAGLTYTARVFVALFYPTGQSSAEVSEYFIWISLIFHSTSAVLAVLVGILQMMSIGYDMLQGRIEESETDALTKLGNRRRLERLIDEEGTIREAIGAVLVIDLDHFKKINDRFGHEGGDVVLRMVGQRLEKLLAPFGAVCRTGGEEFVALIDEDYAAGASALGLAVRKAIATLDLPPQLANARVTASIGFYLRTSEEPLTHAIQRADQAVYCAKADGRNRVVGAVNQNGLNVLKAVA